MATLASASAPAPARVPKRSQKKIWGFAAFVLLTLFVTYGKNQDVFTNPNSQMLAHYRPGMVWLIPHAIFSSVALFAALFQFSNRLRAKYPGFHRKLGYVYVTCVFIGAPIAIPLAAAIGNNGLVWASFVQTFGWVVCTAIALYCIRNGNVADHRRWMLRGYPFAVVFTVARTIIPIPAVAKYGDVGVATVVWICIAFAGFLPSLYLDWPRMPKRVRT